MLVFEKRGKPECPEKNLSGKDENQQQTQPTCDAESGKRTQATLVGGECSHHCAIPAPPPLVVVVVVAAAVVENKLWRANKSAGHLNKEPCFDGLSEKVEQRFANISLVDSKDVMNFVIWQ